MSGAPYEGRHRDRRRMSRASTVVGAIVALLASTAIVAAASTSASRSDDAGPSGVSMPVGDLAGWKQTFSDDFTTPVAAGAFPDSSYSRRWTTYDGFTDTSGHGTYSTKGISVHDGVLDMDMKTVAGVPRAAAIVPLVGGKWGGQTHGRYSVRMESDAVTGYGAAFLLWSDDNTWDDGEVDFPEGALSGGIAANNHCPGNPEQKCLSVPTTATFQQWHTYTIDWTPDQLSFEVDGAVVASTTEHIPTASLHWVLQVGTNDVRPPASAEGHVRIDWATVYRYSPGTAPSGGGGATTGATASAGEDAAVRAGSGAAAMRRARRSS